MYEENNVICLVNSIFLHKGLEIPPPFQSNAKFLNLFNQMQNNSKINKKKAKPVAGFPNGLIVVEPSVLVHRLVVQKLLGHLPFES